MTDFNYKTLELLKDTTVLAQQKELDELILMASAEDDTIAQVMTEFPVVSLVRLLMMVTASIEQLGELLILDSENLELLKEESDKLQQLLVNLR